MSEHEEYMPLCTDKEEEEENHCITCRVELNKTRDGTTNTNYLCRNCYWREQNKKTRQDIIKMNCYSCENTFDWEDRTGNTCNDCTE